MPANPDGAPPVMNGPGRSFGWRDAPAKTQAWLEQFLDGLRLDIGPNLKGIYLHGSLAMGGFNPQRSDVDLLVATHERLSPDVCRRVRQMVLDASRSPHPIELSVLSHQDLWPWKFPTPFDLHYSEAWRTRCTAQDAAPMPDRDPDLAAHIAVLQQRGIILFGEPISKVFPIVPREDFLAAVYTHDVMGSARRITENPVYCVLNLCRLLLYLRTGQIASKREGGEWAAKALEEGLRVVPKQALGCYTSSEPCAAWDAGALVHFADRVEAQIVQVIGDQI